MFAHCSFRMLEARGSASIRAGQRADSSAWRPQCPARSRQSRPELLEFAELTGIPVVTTLMARGAFPDGHRLHYGMPGMHGTVAAVAALQKSDLLITLGARFDDRVTGEVDSFAPDAKVIHADIDPAEICKNRYADVRSSATARRRSPRLIDALGKDRASAPVPDLGPWLAFSTTCAGPIR